MLDSATKMERRIKARFAHLVAELQVAHICNELADPPADDEIKAAATEISGILSGGAPIERYTEFVEKTIRKQPRGSWVYHCTIVQPEMLGE